MSILQVSVPRKLGPLLQPARYKAAYGGRGGGKSHFFAEQVVLRCYEQTTRVACIREVQNSLKESVRQLIIDKIESLGLGGFFDIKDAEIKCPNGSLIIFKGMQAYNAQNIKSLEGFDIAWVEEAQTFSAISLRMLRPTIRKESSEIWFSWNPMWDTDAVDLLFRGASRPNGSCVVEINWNDNPWFPDVLHQEKDDDYHADAEMAEHVWGGGYQTVSEGAYYARLISQAEKEGRIGIYPYDPSKPVETSWDIGVDDYTAIWFWQRYPDHINAIDFFECSDLGADECISMALPEEFRPPQSEEKYVGWSAQAALSELGRDRPFKYGEHWFPHDIRMREWGAGARTRVQIVKEYGLGSIRKGVATKPVDRIAAARRLIPVVNFNNNSRVSVGLKRLRRFRRKFNDQMGTYMGPLHDENSHAADSFGEYAMNSPLASLPKKPKDTKINTSLPTIDQLVKEYTRNRRHQKSRI